MLGRGSVLRYMTPTVQTANLYSGQYICKIVTADGSDGKVNDLTLLRLFDEIVNVFNEIIEYVSTKERLRGNDRMQIVLQDTRSGIMISTPYMFQRDINGEYILVLIEEYLTSMETLYLLRTKVMIKFSRGLRGGAYHKTYVGASDFVNRKRCCVKTTNNENNCFYECLALGRAQVYAPEVYKQLTSGSAKQRRHDEARKLREICNIHEPDEMVDFASISKFERLFCLCVIVVDFRGMRIVYKGEKYIQNYVCFLYSRDAESDVGHFDYVNRDKIGALWEKRKFCFKCFKGYQDNKHGCIEVCKACQTSECMETQVDLQELHCRDCNIMFRNVPCFNRHLQKDICVKRRRCYDCGYIFEVRKKNPHVCYKRKCRNCKKLVDFRYNHKCYHQQLTDKELKKPSDKYVFYDYECMIDNGVHKVAGVVAMYMDSNAPIMFDSNEAFVKWIFQDKHQNFTFVAHNGGRYDLHFVKAEMLKNGIVSSDVSNGHTIFYSHVARFKIRFIDSYKLIPVGLRKFTKTFGLNELTKGYFPYTFFTPERRNYRGPMPGLEYFDFDSLSSGDRVKALEWYEEHKNDDIDLFAMCMDYCVSDVKLLKEGCLEFRRWFMEISEQLIDPLQYITIASVCMTLYRRFFLPGNTIGVLNLSNTYQMDRERHYWLGYQMNVVGREFVLNTKGFDAWDPITNTGYDFLNCLDYGCKRCFSPFRIHPVNFKCMNDLHYAWSTREYQSRYVYIWGCQYDKFCETTPNFYETDYSDVQLPLNPRDAFFGGRTEPIKLYYKCSPGEKIRYYDYTSLYPSIQSGSLRGITHGNDLDRIVEFPVGHPIVIKTNFKPLIHYFGFVKCTVEAPENMYMPLLPEKKNGKLIFDTITKTGTWTTIEVIEAVEQGYKVLKIFEVWHFPHRSSTLFNGYVNKFLKLKQEAKGWKDLGCTSAEEKAEFVRDYEVEQGIALDPEAIGSYNPGKYAIAKLCLNNLWGKYGQRDTFSNSIDTFDHETFHQYVHSDEYEVLGVVMHNSNARTITYRQRKEFISQPGYTNIAIAAFTTAHARLRLFEALKVTGQDTLYMDTDSVIFVDRGDTPLKTGPYLGELTDELNEGEWIEEFVSTGPKSYAYKLNTGKTVCKCKGVSLNHKTSQLINFDLMKRMVYDPTVSVLTKPLQFIIGEKHDIQTKEWAEDDGKRFKLTMDKRRVLFENCISPTIINTIPY